MKVKVGPITAQYSGVARFVEQDEAAGRAVLSAEGRDTRGAGNARATITATLSPDGDGTNVDVETDLDITGRVAQFGRGVLGDVSAKLMDEFASCLSAQLATDQTSPEPSGRTSLADDAESTPTEGAAGAESSGGRTSAGHGAESTPAGAVPAAPVDLVRVVGGALGRRLGPVLGAGGLALWLLWRNRRKRRRRRR